MGIAGLILGILGVIGSFIPGLVWGAWILAVVGIILSAIGMKKAKAANQSAGAAIAGLVLSIISVVIAIPMLICTIVAATAVNSFGSGLGLW